MLLSRIVGAIRRRFRPEKPLDALSRADYYRSMGVKIGEGTRFEDHTYMGSEPYLVEIGANCLFSGAVQILTHDGGAFVCKSLYGLEASATKFGRVKVGDNCFIGARAILMPGVTIGDGVVIGAGSVVTHNVPSGEVWAGNPAHFIKKTADYAAKIAASCHTPEQEELKAIVYKRRGLA